jgi:hypothetical protein
VIRLLFLTAWPDFLKSNSKIDLTHVKRYLLPAAFLLTFYWPVACTNNESTTTTSDSLSTATTPATTDAVATTTTTHSISESETYTDLKSGKTFRIKRDASGNYASENGEPLTYYYSTTSHDTFYGPTARWVNNALTYDASKGYSIDESRVSVGSSGGMGTPDKVKSTESEFKAKSNDGEDKVKVTEDESKMKSSDGSKIKTNENETKIKNKSH